MEKELMPMRTTMIEALSGRALTWLVASAVSGLLLAADARWSRAAEESGTKTFSSAADACKALFHAVRADDAQALETILGPELSSSAESEGKLERRQFDAKYCEMHRLVREPDGTTVLYVGAENWPFPVPLVAENGRWRFDAEMGQREVLHRRIGRDEATAVGVCEALSRKTKGHAAGPTSDDPIDRYAEQLLAAAGAGTSAESPFHGYDFRVVTKGAHKTGRGNDGQADRAVLFVAYPADYRSSGVMTFVVTADGAVYEKDLGPNTSTVAADLKERPARGWRAVRAQSAAQVARPNG